MMNLIQFKMTSGDEIIAEVMEWPDDNSKDMIVRNAMILTYSFDEDFTNQIYGLKPWFSMIENPLEYISVDTHHIMSTTRPNNSFVKEYTEALIQMHSLGQKRKIEERRELEEFEKLFKDRLERVSKQMLESDSAVSNVLQFPPPDTSIH